jgi:hypothetical protein
MSIWQKTFFSSTSIVEGEHSGGVAFTVVVEQPVHKVLSPRAEFLRKEP